MERDPGFESGTMSEAAELVLAVPVLGGREDVLEIGMVSALLDGLPRQAIGYAPWAEERPQVEASFSIAHGQDYIYLKYYVQEAAIRAEHLNINDPVYEDSCVEFFVAFDDDAAYYNLEFNCIGTCLGQYGTAKIGRTFLPPALLSRIRHQTQIKNSVGGQIYWELTLCIPTGVFNRHEGLELAKHRIRVNFYKCGDKLPVPHYLSWNNIAAAGPEFHLIDFFREIAFLPHNVNT
jgi:hypothetical protein